MPDVLPQAYKTQPSPRCASETMVDDAWWYAEKIISIGGAAGKGPEAPKPASLPEDVGSDSQLIVDEIDQETENKTKMAFAKMQIPSELKTKFILTETDFALNENNETEDLNATTGGGGANDLLTGSKLDEADGKTNGAGSPKGGRTSPAHDSPKGGRLSRLQSGAGTNSDAEDEKGHSPTRARGSAMRSRSSSEAKGDGADPKPKRPRSRQSKEKDAISMSEKASQLGLYA